MKRSVLVISLLAMAITLQAQPFVVGATEQVRPHVSAITKILASAGISVTFEIVPQARLAPSLAD